MTGVIDASANNPTDGREARRAGAFVVGRVLAQATELAVWLVVVRIATLREAGILALALLGSRYAGFAADFGAQYSGARDVARHGADSAHVSGLIVRRERTTAVAVASFAIALLLFGQPGLLPMTALVAFRGMNRDWLAHGSGRVKHATVPVLIQSASALAILAIAPRVDVVPWAFGAGGFLALTTSLTFNRLCERRPGVASSVNGWYAVTGMAGLVHATADSFLLGVFDGAGTVAVYASVYRFPNAWLLILGLAVTASVPHITTRIQAGDDQRIIRRRLAAAGALGAIIVLASTPLLQALVPLVFTEAFSPGVDALGLLMISTAVVTIGAPMQALVMNKRPDRETAVVISASALANMAMNLVLIPRWGMEGAALATLVAQFGPTTYFWWVAFRSEHA